MLSSSVSVALSARRLGGGAAPNVRGGQEEAPAVLLEGPGVPRAAGETRSALSGTTEERSAHARLHLPGRPGRSGHSQIHGVVRKLHMCGLQTGLLPHPGTWDRPILNTRQRRPQSEPKCHPSKTEDFVGFHSQNTTVMNPMIRW